VTASGSGSNIVVAGYWSLPAWVSIVEWSGGVVQWCSGAVVQWCSGGVSWAHEAPVNNASRHQRPPSNPQGAKRNLKLD